MINYTATIFAESGSEISPKLSAIVVAAIQLVGTLVATQLVDRVGRKVSVKRIYSLHYALEHFFIAFSACLLGRPSDRDSVY